MAQRRRLANQTAGKVQPQRPILTKGKSLNPLTLEGQGIQVRPGGQDQVVFKCTALVMEDHVDSITQASVPYFPKATSIADPEGGVP
jgi:hypothetical protein